MMTIGNFSLSRKLKSSRDRPIYVLLIGKGIASCFHILSIVSCSDHLLTPAMFCMTVQVTGRLGITLVKESTHKSSLAKAVAHTTFENVGLTIIDIFNRRGWLKENINRCVPFF